MLKDEYKKVLENLKTETYERTKAETIVKILQETLEAKDELGKQVIDEESLMEIDDTENETGEWQKQKSKKRKMRKRNRKSEDIEKCSHCEIIFQSKESLEVHKQEHRTYKCELCDENFSIKSELTKHSKSHAEKQEQWKMCDELLKDEVNQDKHSQNHSTHSKFECNDCENTFINKKELDEHVKNHSDKILIECNQCEQRFPNKRTIDIHRKMHEMPTKIDEHQCCKCNQVYKDMRKLRRHDWRAHRAIDCSMCGDTISSRQEMKQHREIKHKMFKKLACKFFPDCYDEDECLYEHINIENDSQESGCPNGEKCSNQECEFNENEHKNSRKIMCRFQARCNRGGCQYQHIGQRQAFLGLSLKRNVKT